ncbi:MAG: YebC/PmpR family DNA-binding transcriptional regulator [Pseudomonadales bacterium]|mgnify:CR=1 FL=1|jgi:YebC/PmpR family DNA-binding regulatory protein|uniref:YebC/PmpR family DNA-binding transcriptional regulator n=1 Tax=unclassified Ketobacter TaxID=2639109 RepID=UPI000C9955AD|nr:MULTISPECIES: YebC/PmpR family DNA-binding transcriptional regulator [unclassified Ketobacter]MAA60408.1 YebC/PmpR family DNA-binding transcriptional regulator [Pseudomonadales bacterium]MEC8813155.1 YebC/PmpR family DNA-binding transcriptional regulator [Pseudomonadota bacterium]TNC90034.1 MAG: YebC/PmpR family DNA-binding transcriptional regulator [Alcanivorax sp.]HAG97174.1 YebC/PmpR family DNA-binding transcriptional regulator [Gammaproteobacteria bacterium]MAQ26311.1 YebC/PmpR family D|tara:strand:- start:4667 stop:5413 length:747 start_codon:yes stop_codon:yes gene_type:complete
MAGHSKWANIKHRKAAQDAKRGKIFTRLIREITIAARSGAAPEDNPRLRLAMDKALAANMTKETIERAVKRGAGGDDGGQLDELTYEGYGVGGVAVIVEAMTDNRNRTAGEVRHAFSKFGGNLGTDGSVAYLFTKRGEITFEPGVDEESVLEAALEAGAEDVLTLDDGSIEVITAWEDLGKVKSALDEAGLVSAGAEINMAASVQVDMDLDTATTVLKMIDMLEELDDVQNVYTNANFTQELMEQMDT